MIKKIFSFFAFSAVLLCLMTSQSFAATAADSMHYGKQPSEQVQKINGKDGTSIVITNCSTQLATVSAWFTDGSSKTMTIYPVYKYPMNIISIDNSFPYVNIEVDAEDGTILFPYQAVYPGQNVNIGCSMQKPGHKLTVTVTHR